MRSRRRDKRRNRTGPRPRLADSASIDESRSAEPDASGTSKRDTIGLERLLFFNDAVFAIAITLLVIDIRLPDNAGADLAGALRDLAPNFAGFVFSFLVIALYWITHHHIFQYIRDYDHQLIWINVLFLMSVAFLLFSTSLINSYGDQSLAVIFYALNMVVIGVIFMLLWIHAVYRGRLIDPATPHAVVRQATLRLAIVPVVFLASVPLALFSPNGAKLFWLLIPVLRHFVVNRRQAG